MIQQFLSRTEGRPTRGLGKSTTVVVQGNALRVWPVQTGTIAGGEEPMACREMPGGDQIVVSLGIVFRFGRQATSRTIHKNDRTRPHRSEDSQGSLTLRPRVKLGIRSVQYREFLGQGSASFGVRGDDRSVHGIEVGWEQRLAGRSIERAGTMLLGRGGGETLG